MATCDRCKGIGHNRAHEKSDKECALVQKRAPDLPVFVERHHARASFKERLHGFDALIVHRLVKGRATFRARVHQAGRVLSRLALFQEELKARSVGPISSRPDQLA